MASKKAAKQAATKTARTRGRGDEATPLGERPVESLTPNPRNPRLPWRDERQRDAFMRSLTEFGDLSGIVFNVRTRQLVGGHKRVDEFKADPAARVHVTESFVPAAADGTTAIGHVMLASGVRFQYREVSWPRPKEAAANLAANKWGAEWDLPAVADLMREGDAGGFAMDLTGFELPVITGFLDGTYGDDSEATGGQGADEREDSNALDVPVLTRQQLVDIFGEAAAGSPREEVRRGEVWRVNDSYLVCCDLIRQHDLWAPLITRLKAEFPTRRILFIPCPDPFMVGVRDERVACVMVQPSALAASWAMTFLTTRDTGARIARCTPDGALTHESDAEQSTARSVRRTAAPAAKKAAKKAAKAAKRVANSNHVPRKHASRR